MNRLAPTQIHRVVSLAATAWLMTSMNGFAQLSMPPGTPTSLPTNSTTPNMPVADSPATQVAKAKEALAKKDFKAAVDHYRRAAANPTPEISWPLKTIRAELLGAGVDAALLTPLAVTNAPPAAKVSAGSPVAERKQEALRLLALGRVAMDRGDLAEAVGMAHQAQALNVPETAFGPGEPRVWEFVLDAESAARRAGMSLPAPAGVLPAVANSPAGVAESPNVAQSVFNGGTPGTDPAMVRQVQREGDVPNLGEQFYQEGLQALTGGDKDLARAKFVEAWKYEAQLDLNTRSQLQDKLTLLQPSRLPTAEAEAGMPLTPIQRAELESQQQTQRLYREVQTELTKASELRESQPLQAADQLESLLRRVEAANVDEAAKRTMAALVNRALGEQLRYNEANKAMIDLKLRNEAIESQMVIEQAQNERIDEEIKSLVEEFNALIDQRRYPEAEVVAKQVAELRPDSTIAANMLMQSRMKTRLLMNQEVRGQLEDSFVKTMLDVERAGITMDPDKPLEFRDAREWNDISTRRLSAEDGNTLLSPREQEIQRKLASQEVEINYQNRPLGQVVSDLSAMADMNIVLDNRALSAIRVDSSTPVNLQLNRRVLLKSALNIMLDDLDCSYIIRDDSLIITSREAKRSNVFQRVYRVADIVTPIPNFTTSYDDGLAGALRAAYQMASPQADVQIMPVSAVDIGRGMAQSMSPATMGPTALGPNVLGQYNPMGSQGGFGPSNAPIGGRGGAAFADFDSLMNLIQTTVVPDTWEALGGPSTMAPYQQNLSLVISTTSDVHDQIADLLESLRRLQNLQITIEVRFITLSDNFFEQIGIDFDLQFDDNITSFPNDDSGSSVTVGFGADGLPTADFDIRLDNNSFGVAPIFGGFDAAAATTFGWAILSDIEAFFFLQAAQGDSRTNVMQAPKVTLFDGQFASISDVSQRPFVTSITPVVGDFAVAQQPVIVVLNEGTQLNVQGVVSEDKRFVRLTLVPFFSQIGDVDTFTFEGRRTTNRRSRQEEDTNGDGVVDEDDAVDEENEQETIEGTTVQLPTFAFTSVSTTVSVPDGGTILLGGIKRLSEGRAERGVPILSKIPYVSRLFRNVSVGREAQSLMLMVTPRIIIQEEEEIAQTGFDPGR